MNTNWSQAGLPAFPRHVPQQQVMVADDESANLNGEINHRLEAMRSQPQGYPVANSLAMASGSMHANRFNLQPYPQAALRPFSIAPGLNRQIFPSPVYGWHITGYRPSSQAIIQNMASVQQHQRRVNTNPLRYLSNRVPYQNNVDAGHYSDSSDLLLEQQVNMSSQLQQEVVSDSSTQSNRHINDLNSIEGDRAQQNEAPRATVMSQQNPACASP